LLYSEGLSGVFAAKHCDGLGEQADISSFFRRVEKYLMGLYARRITPTQAMMINKNNATEDLPVIDACPAASDRPSGCDKVGTGAMG